ncbi:MAG: AAA family ATPase [Ghiorsea sp.]|nr:AAA family ATPase [Ghiorsea sp.]
MEESIVVLERKIIRGNRMTDEELAVLNNKWDQFLEVWSVEKVQSMTLEQYTKTGDKSTFTWWLESGLGELGSIWGGSSFKFGVYSRADDEQKENSEKLRYNEKYAWLGKYGDTPEIAFEKIKSEILKTIGAVQKGDLQAIDHIDLGDGYKWKIAFHYQNRSSAQVVNVFKEEMLQTVFGSEHKNMSDLYRTAMSKKGDMDLLSYGKKIWEEYGDKKSIVIWKVSHGIKDFSEKEHQACLHKGIVVVHSATRKGQGEDFVDKAQVGDFVYLTRGNERIEFLGQITSDAEPYEGDGWVCRRVKTLFKSTIDGSYTGPKKGWTPNYNSTFYQVQLKDLKAFEKHILRPYFDKDLMDLLQLNVLSDESLNSEMNRVLNGNKIEAAMKPLNRILYGPPGTGKTYNTVKKAVEICDGKICDNGDDARKRYKELQKEGRIEFVTFHQSYGYEEFIEGIRAETIENSDDTSSISYDVQPGVFKRISQLAGKNSGSKKSGIKEFTDVFKDAVIDKVSKDEKLEITMTRSRFFIKEVTERTIFFDKDKGESKHSLSIKTLHKIYNAGSNQIIVGGLQPYYEALLQYLMKYSQTTVQAEKKNYVLIIDEINRGNMSKIFGELITLIEDDKRIGAANEMTVRLPVSGDEFGVPANLHIIGTMNTADRSIAMMDTALRRRFEFEEMMPEASLLKDIEVAGIKLERMLKAINQRIEVLYDREHTIGHAFFMGLTNEVNNKVSLGDLAAVFQNKVIPLLAEYFFEDWEKIRLVLGDNQKEQKEHQFIVEKEGVNYQALFGDESSDYSDERKVYERNPDALDHAESYIGIYEPKPKSKKDTDS